MSNIMTAEKFGRKWQYKINIRKYFLVFISALLLAIWIGGSIYYVFSLGVVASIIWLIGVGALIVAPGGYLWELTLYSCRVPSMYVKPSDWNVTLCDSKIQIDDGKERCKLEIKRITKAFEVVYDEYGDFQFPIPFVTLTLDDGTSVLTPNSATNIDVLWEVIEESAEVDIRVI